MKAAAIVMVLLALVVFIAPQYTDCESQGRHIETADGRMIPMKCHWTGRAEMGLAVPLVGVGFLMNFSRRKETLLSLGIIGALLGVFMILLPTALVGVCASPEMICNAVMKPTLILTGTLTSAVSMIVLGVNSRSSMRIQEPSA